MGKCRFVDRIYEPKANTLLSRIYTLESFLWLKFPESLLFCNDAGVRCNCVRNAIMSAPDTFAYAIVSGAMQKSSGGHVHDIDIDTHSKQMANVFCRPRAFNLLQGRFCTGQTQLHICKYAYMLLCPGGHNCILQQRPGGHDYICKTVLRTVLHTGHSCMRHRLYS